MKRTLLLLASILAIGAVSLYAGYRFSQARPGVLRMLSAVEQLAPLQATGILEASAVAVSSDLGGRITSLPVAEGDQVAAGQLLLILDDGVLQAQASQAEAAVAEAQAQLDLLQAGARLEEISRAAAVSTQATTAAKVAQQTWDDAQRLRERPDDLEMKIIEAETTLAQAEHQAAASTRLAEGADLQVDLWSRVTRLLQEGFDVTLPFGGTIHVDRPVERAQANTQWNLSGQSAWEAWQTAYAAEDAVQAARTQLADLQRQRASLIELDAQVQQAEAATYRAQAAADQAKAALQVVKEGARPEQIEVARRTVAQARAARDSLDVPLAKTQLHAPVGGLVTQVTVRPGEVALPGAPLLEIADLSQVVLTVFVAEPALGRVRLGQDVTVSIDSFPGRGFGGRVTRIADEAEFTPRNVQSKEARAQTVYAVEITLDNPDGALKPGMPADATFSD